MSNLVFDHLSSSKFREVLDQTDLKLVKNLLIRIRKVINSKIADLNEAIQSSCEDIIYAGYLESKIQGMLDETTLTLEAEIAKLSEQSRVDHFTKGVKPTVASIESDVKSSKSYQDIVRKQISIKEVLNSIKAIKLATIKKRDSLDQVCNNERLQLRDTDYV